MVSGIPIRTAETIGMAQRGGSVFSHLRLGPDVHSPMIAPGEADCILSFEPAEAVRMLPYLRRGGTVITAVEPVYPVSSLTGGPAYDRDAIMEALQRADARVICVDTRKALEALGNDKVTNVVMLGAAAQSGAIGLTREAIAEAIRRMLPEKVQAINQKALTYENPEK